MLRNCFVVLLLNITKYQQIITSFTSGIGARFIFLEVRIFRYIRWVASEQVGEELQRIRNTKKGYGLHKLYIYLFILMHLWEVVSYPFNSIVFFFSSCQLDTKRRPRDIDQIQDDLVRETSLGKQVPVEPDEDLPGLGQFYCTPCARHFADEKTLATHQTSKLHKRRQELIDRKKYSYRINIVLIM